MKIKPKQYAISLYEAVAGAPSDKVGQILANFVKILVKKNALRVAPQIIEYFKNYANRAEGTVEIKIKTAGAIKDELTEKIKKITPKIFGQSFKKINVKKEIDQSLLGGFVLETEDKIFDASVKNKFQTLNKILNQ
jgi:F-type H+-transporting ATPase subunit delta